MNELNQLTEHNAFIARSDRKSLYTQIKNLVHQAQEVANKELNQRRNTLKRLLEHEDQVYEEEFANKVRSRIDEDIRERRDVLLKIKEESTKNELEFLQSKRIHQYMNSCYEIREALRRQETLNIKECQLEQMLDKQHTARKEKDLDKYWLKVQNINLQLTDARLQEENCLKKEFVKHVAVTRNAQLKELQEKREKERQDKLEEKHKLDELLEQLRLERFDQEVQRKPSKATEYRQELTALRKEKLEMRRIEEQREVEKHQQMMCDIARLAAEESAAAKEKKKAFYKATMDFIKYVKSVRQLNQAQDDISSERINELRRIDMCTKNNMLLERERKARIAEKCYAELRQQICEQQKKRLIEEAEYRENKMMENRFVHKEISREEVLHKKLQTRRELEKQIEELKKIRETEDAKFSQDLKRASNDPIFCTKLAEKYIREGIDYLEPHANWRILPCSRNNTDVKIPSARIAKDLLSRGKLNALFSESCSCIPHGIRNTISHDEAF